VTGAFELGERERGAVREALSRLERDVDVTLELGPSAAPVTLLAGGGQEIDTGAVTRDVVESVCRLGARSNGRDGARGAVRLTVVERDEPGPWPRTTIGAGLVYQGMPVGYELTTLVHGIVEAGRSASSLSPTSIDRLAALERDVAIDVFVTPT
jgi:hypothetical protein